MASLLAIRLAAVRGTPVAAPAAVRGASVVGTWVSGRPCAPACVPGCGPVAAVHSKRAAKKLVGHPLSVRGRVANDKKWAEIAEAAAAPLKWVPKELPEDVGRTWWQWVPPAGPMEGLPFNVTRTAVGKRLPVYSDFKNGRTRELTVVRLVEGDRQALADELRKVCDGTQVEVKLGRIEVKGAYLDIVRRYLLGLGF